ncbi:MAG: helix-turn-helix domain-containing protein, partial [SAR202 cluster bacterium]|nr:helix-turn-helix domain-containing protein [SAR202 cluster bacterium]
MRGLHLTERETKRAQILNLVLEGRCEASKAAELMGVSERHVWRMLSRYRQEGL